MGGGLLFQFGGNMMLISMNQISMVKVQFESIQVTKSIDKMWYFHTKIKEPLLIQHGHLVKSPATSCGASNNEKATIEAATPINSPFPSVIQETLGNLAQSPASNRKLATDLLDVSHEG
jgi:hypothetical protein